MSIPLTYTSTNTRNRLSDQPLNYTGSSPPPLPSNTRRPHNLRASAGVSTQKPPISNPCPRPHTPCYRLFPHDNLPCRTASLPLPNFRARPVRPSRVRPANLGKLDCCVVECNPSTGCKQRQMHIGNDHPLGPPVTGFRWCVTRAGASTQAQAPRSVYEAPAAANAAPLEGHTQIHDLL